MNNPDLRIEIGWGREFDKDNKPIGALEGATMLSAVEAEAIKLFGGYTLLPVVGGWESPTNGLVTEKGYTLLIFTHADFATRVKAKGLAAFIKGVFNQQAVALTFTECKHELV